MKHKPIVLVTNQYQATNKQNNDVTKRLNSIHILILHSNSNLFIVKINTQTY